MADELRGDGASAPDQVNTVVEAQLDRAAEEVARRFGERVDQDVVRQAIGDAYGRLARRSRFVGFLPPVEVRPAEVSAADVRPDPEDVGREPIA